MSFTWIVRRPPSRVESVATGTRRGAALLAKSASFSTATHRNSPPTTRTKSAHSMKLVRHIAIKFDQKLILYFRLLSQGRRLLVSSPGWSFSRRRSQLQCLLRETSYLCSAEYVRLYFWRILLTPKQLVAAMYFVFRCENDHSSGTYTLISQQCIRQWRASSKKDSDVVTTETAKSCPYCRTSSRFVTPSSQFFPENHPRKAEIIARYRASMARVPCKYVDFSHPSTFTNLEVQAFPEIAI